MKKIIRVFAAVGVYVTVKYVVENRDSLKQFATNFGKEFKDTVQVIKNSKLFAKNLQEEEVSHEDPNT